MFVQLKTVTDVTVTEDLEEVLFVFCIYYGIWVVHGSTNHGFNLAPGDLVGSGGR